MTTETSAVTWASLNLNEIDVDSKPEGSTERSELPSPATYKLKLVGAKANPFQSGTTDIDFVVVEGPHARQHLFATLPSPGKYSWVSKAAAFLIKRMGVAQLPGEELIETLNRGAANGAGTISADVAPDTYVNNKGQSVTKPKLQYFSITAAV